MNLLMTAQEQTFYDTLWDRLEIRDRISLEPELILDYVRASIRARRELNYAADVPEDLFYDYVLPIRVNNEYPDGSRGWLYEQLKDRVMEKSILDAALEVNYWCYEQATYSATDDRTIGPLGMCRRTKGRCGEESTLLVSALRAVGIPARQVYVPYWSHCDDNHAWAEFWSEGVWHYLGACEPEPVPDVGWFQSAASRAMLVRSRVPDPEMKCGYRTVNSTALYADTVNLRVFVQKDGKAVPGVRVRFQIVNESRIVTLHSEITGQSGGVSFETGFGCLIVSAYFGGRLVEHLVDLRMEREIVLKWEDGFDPLTEERTSFWELVPPDEKLPPWQEPDASHQARLRKCEQKRAAFEQTFSGVSPWLETARGNWKEIEKFLNLSNYASEDKEALLSTLSEKDFADVNCEILEEYLAESLLWKDRFPPGVWKNSILAPRVEHEMLLPVRRRICQLLEKEYLESEEQVREWMNRNICPIPEYGLTDRRGNGAKYVQHRLCPESEWEILRVQICRALGIPASLANASGQKFRLKVSSEESLRWRENWTVARWEAGEYRVVDQPVDHLKPGSYSLITSRRQIDGTVSARAERFLLKQDREVEALFQRDLTAKKLKAVPLAESGKKSSLLIFLQPGAEPTEHLLMELLELKEELNTGEHPICLRLQSEDQADNATFRRVLTQLQYAHWDTFDPREHFSIQTAMGIGDARLPLAVVLDSGGKGVYGCANYNIRSAHTMLRILKII